MKTMYRDSEWEEHWTSYLETRRISREMLGERESAPAAQGVSVTVAMEQGGDPLITKLLNSVKKPFLMAESMGAGFHTASVSTGDEREAFKEGDVLQLSSEFSDERRVFVYVLSLDTGSVEVALFSPLGLPASREEIRTELEKEGLEVLQLWNTRTFSPWVLSRSWRVLEAECALKEDVRLMLKLEQEGGEIPESLAKRQGGSVVSPLDVRWNYFEEEKEFLAELETGT